MKAVSIIIGTLTVIVIAGTGMIISSNMPHAPWGDPSALGKELATRVLLPFVILPLQMMNVTICALTRRSVGTATSYIISSYSSP